ncbi:MAG: ABC transporter ATP-binding protein/permease [Anaerolineae bacterium]|nr:ABC transporter ATP-binding protein/permease [Anaerolineae bacterium]
MPSMAVQTHALTKRFPPPIRLKQLLYPRQSGEGVLAVDRVNLAIPQGQIFGLVGPNGAGKTTLVKMLCTLILPTSGAAHIHGLATSQERPLKRLIGLMTGNERHFYWRLTGRENLRFYAGLHNLDRVAGEKRIAELAGLLRLEEFMDRRFDAYSTGMKHRLALACSLIHNPALLFLDEPTRSLDPVAAYQFREVIYTLAHSEQRTIFLVTHNLNEAVELCDQVAVMVAGQLRLIESPKTLQEQLRPQNRCTLTLRNINVAIAGELRALAEDAQPLEPRLHQASTRVTIKLPTGKTSLPEVLQSIEAHGGIVDKIEFGPASWEQIFADAREVLPEPANGDKTRPISVRESAQNESGVTPDTKFPLTAGWKRIARGLRKPLLFLRRDFLSEVSYRFDFILQVIGILFSTTAFYFISALLGPSALPYLGDYSGDYFAFVLLGIAFMGYQGVALSTFAKVIRSGQVSGTLEGLLITPTRLSTILLSSSLWDFLFTTLRVSVYLLLGIFVFGMDLGSANVVAGLSVLLLTMTAVSGIGIFSAAFIMILKRGDPVAFMFSNLSSLLGGVYYPVEILPAWLQLIARFFPLTYALEAMRRALLNGDTLGALWREVAMLAVFSAVLLPTSLYAFRKAVRLAKRDGSLTQY